MYTNIHVTEVAVVGDHRLMLRFEDGVEGEVDFADREWRGIFEPLSDPAYFRRVGVDDGLGTIAWPNGADMAHDTLYHWIVTGSRPL
jgi:hypothetical protein